MAFDNDTLGWVETLTGLERERVVEACDCVHAWSIEHLDRELLQISSLDNAVATTLLREAVRALTAAGVPEPRLLTKLRRDRDVWPTWAELRAAALLLRVAEPGTVFHLEPDRAAGSHSDFRLTPAGGGPSRDIEFKAIGLSDEEAGFCRRVSPALDALLPPQGLVTCHAELALTRFPLEKCDIPEMHAQAAVAMADVPEYPAGLAGVTIVGRLGEPNYARRALLRLRKEVVTQIPAGATGWAAFHWTNGALIRGLLGALRWEDIPREVDGLIFLGDAVVFPSANVHSFQHIVRRGAAPDSNRVVQSTSQVENLASVILDRFERSAGVRPTLLSGSTATGRRELMRRDGTRRILPFNLLLDADPPNALGPNRSVRAPVPQAF